MAKRRDSLSSRTTRAVREARRDNRGRPVQAPMRVDSNRVNIIRDMYPEQMGENPRSAFRTRGRRGVRQRARDARINARKVSGTYRQPGGGTVTNS